MAEFKKILITGASGYVAKHVVLRALQAGYAVRGTVRSAAKGDQVRAAMARHLDGGDPGDRLEFALADLTSDEGWAAAMDGVDALIHTASPFPSAPPKDADDVIRPAVDGTLRVLRAAQGAGVFRLVLTSSTVAVLSARDAMHTEDDWQDLPKAGAYEQSKVRAERAAWDFVKTHPEMQMTVINPSFVQGAPLDDDFATSLEMVQRFLSGKDPMLPNLGFPVVDVRDVARLHVDALTTEGTIGERFIAADRFLTMRDMAEAIAVAVPDRKIVTRGAPDILIRFLSLFDPAVRMVLPFLGRRADASGDKARRVFGQPLLPAAEAVQAGARYLVDNGHA